MATRVPALSVVLPPATSAGLPAPDPFRIIYSAKFWVLGVFIIINDIWVQEQFDQYLDISNQARFTSIQSPAAAALLRQRTSRRYFWLQPHITTLKRQIIATLLCALFIPLQLVELRWLGSLAWEVSQMAFCQTCIGDDGTVRGTELSQKVLWCLPTASLLTLLWLWLLRKSIGIIFTQLSYVLQLKSLRPEAPLDLSHKWRAPGDVSL